MSLFTKGSKSHCNTMTLLTGTTLDVGEKKSNYKTKKQKKLGISRSLHFSKYYKNASTNLSHVIQIAVNTYLTILIWKSASWTVFHDPDRKSLHHKNALLFVSRSTSSLLPSRKDSASESSSTWGLGVLRYLSLTKSEVTTRFLPAEGQTPSEERVWLEMLLLWSPCSVFSAVSKTFAPELLWVAFRPDCIVSLRARSKWTPP